MDGAVKELMWHGDRRVCQEWQRHTYLSSFTWANSHVHIPFVFNGITRHHVPISRTGIWHSVVGCKALSVLHLAECFCAGGGFGSKLWWAGIVWKLLLTIMPQEPCSLVNRWSTSNCHSKNLIDLFLKLKCQVYCLLFPLKNCNWWLHL